MGRSRREGCHGSEFAYAYRPQQAEFSRLCQCLLKARVKTSSVTKPRSVDASLRKCARQSCEEVTRKKAVIVAQQCACLQSVSIDRKWALIEFCRAPHDPLQLGGTVVQRTRPLRACQGLSASVSRMHDCQGLSASVSCMHACHVESSLDVMRFPIHRNNLTDPLVSM